MSWPEAMANPGSRPTRSSAQHRRGIDGYREKAPAWTPYRPEALDLREFLQSSATRGPTAAAGDWQSLAWLRRHAGLVRLPLQASIVKPYRHTQAGHQEEQQVPLRMESFDVLLSILQDTQAAPWRRCAAALIARVLLSCLRWADVARISGLQGQHGEATGVVSA